MYLFSPQLLQQINRSVFPRRKRERAALPSLPERKSALGRDLACEQMMKEHAPQIHQSIEGAIRHLDQLFRPDGYWEGRVYDNSTITAEYVMTLKFLGLLDETTKQKAKAEILSTQLEDGGWNIFYGGPSDQSATVEAYFALKLCGLEASNPALEKAKKLILKGGGVETTRVFTKIHLAFFGEYPWSGVPHINPELMLLPLKSPINFYEFSSWSRAVIIPLVIIFDQKPVKKILPEQSVKELFVKKKRTTRTAQIKAIMTHSDWDIFQLIEIAQKALLIYEKSPIKPLRQVALNKAEEWILEHQDLNGNWGGIFPAMANSLMALNLRGYPMDHPVMEKGLKMLRSFTEDDGKKLRMQSTISPIWDTAIAAYAYQEAGVPFTHPTISKSIDWLMTKQILDKKGDWQFKALPETKPGGWPFEHENDQYPDIDDSALAILAMVNSEKDPKRTKKIAHSIERGVEWILGMQGTDGGWGAFDRDNNREILNQIPFADLKSLLDPSTPDVTGHVIEALGAAGYERTYEPVDRGVEFLKSTQEKDGSWFGRWGVNYIYGTGSVLSGLKMAGEPMNLEYVQKAAKWLVKTQNKDGGWGESCESYDEKKYVPLGYSTASQTSWALIGLLACDGDYRAEIERGVEFLLSHQKEDGGWDEPEWTGTGFPKHFYLRYDYYRLYFPLWALGRYAAKYFPGNGHK